MKYIDSDKLISEIDRQEIGCNTDGKHTAEYNTCRKILDIITSLQQEQPEVDLDALVDEAFDKYSSVDGYGQLSASFNRAELYSFIKKITRKEE